MIYVPWWWSEKKELKEKVRRVEWRKRVGQEENDTKQNPSYCSSKKHKMGCSIHEGVGFICSLITLLPSDVCTYQIQVFLQILKCYRYARNRIANVQNPGNFHPTCLQPQQPRKALCWAVTEYTGRWSVLLEASMQWQLLSENYGTQNSLFSKEQDSAALPHISLLSWEVTWALWGS